MRRARCVAIPTSRHDDEIPVIRGRNKRECRQRAKRGSLVGRDEAARARSGAVPVASSATSACRRTHRDRTREERGSGGAP